MPSNTLAAVLVGLHRMRGPLRLRGLWGLSLPVGFASRDVVSRGLSIFFFSLSLSLFSWVSGCRSLVPLTFRSSIALNVMAGLLLRDLWKLHGMRAPPTWNLCGWCRDLGTCPAFSSRPHSSTRRGPCHALRPPPSTGLVKRSRALSPIPKIKYSWTTSSRKMRTEKTQQRRVLSAPQHSPLEIDASLKQAKCGFQLSGGLAAARSLGSA